jgi:hypothetical protein
MDFKQLIEGLDWKEIPGCPGRYVLQGGKSALSPQDLAGPEAVVQKYSTTIARDPLFVTLFAGGGLISYRQPDGSFVHTLNTIEGLHRKLQQLEVRVDEQSRQLPRDQRSA